MPLLHIRTHPLEDGAGACAGERTGHLERAVSRRDSLRGGSCGFGSPDGGGGGSGGSGGSRMSPLGGVRIAPAAAAAESAAAAFSAAASGAV
ncbi:UNVERIFIED_CONTAM: hypothetical protein OHV15_14555 [Microbacterium sp. SLM126]